MAIAVIPSGKVLGADVEGIDCSQSLAKEIVDRVKRAWAGNLVLRFPWAEAHGRATDELQRELRRAR